MPGPTALIAELTHRCPLHCVYCSNPEAMQPRSDEMDTEQWCRVFREAGELGVHQIHFTGGEPLSRLDLTQLIAQARRAGLYVNLITSGIGLNAQRLEELVSAGLDHVQLSFQDVDEADANRWAGTRAHAHKLNLAGLIRKHRIGFTVNLVVHRNNLDRLDRMIAMAEELHADKLEIANVQYYGWALRNRRALLPTREQLRASLATIASGQERLRGKMRLDYVLPDYYAKYPKPCMGGWGRSLMLMDPAGFCMPCHAAGAIAGMQFNSARDHSLEWIWQQSDAFNKFRGQDWMQEPCRSCDRREQDFGGCRCQAFLLTGDASATDPVCSLSPRRGMVDAILAEIQQTPHFPLIAARDLVYRTDPH
jgi:PqqA peptide cyclase